MQVFYSQGIAILCSQAPALDTLRQLLAQQGYTITAMDEQAPQWPEMEGPNLKVHCPHAPFCEVDICAFPWPDDMGTSGDPTMLTSAHAMGGFGPFTQPGAYERALQAPGYQEAAAAARQHQAFVRIRTSHFLGGTTTQPADTPPAPATPANPPEELRFMLGLASVLAGLPGALAYFNPNAELLMTLEVIAAAPATAAELRTFPMEPFCRYRGCPVDETWSVVDSIGMAQLGLTDHEFAWAGGELTRQEQIGFLVDLLHYQVDKAVHFAGGHTTDGPQGKRWRAQERTMSCMQPPRPVLHWNPVDSPPEPQRLAAYAPDPASVAAAAASAGAEAGDDDDEVSAELGKARDQAATWLAMRDSIRARAAAWVRSPQFRTVYYEDAHPPPTFKAALEHAMPKKKAAELWQKLETVGPQSPALWNQYQQLATQGQVWLAIPMMTNPSFNKEPNMMLPCGLVFSTTQTPEDFVVASMFPEAAYPIYSGEADGSDRPGVARILANDEFRLFYREMFPSEELDGLQLMYMSVMLRNSWMPPKEIPFVPLLAMPGPPGTVIQIPWHVVAGTPPLPGSMEPGRFSDAPKQGAKGVPAAPEEKVGCWNIFSLIIWILFAASIIGGILIKLKIW